MGHQGRQRRLVGQKKTLTGPRDEEKKVRGSRKSPVRRWFERQNRKVVKRKRGGFSLVKTEVEHYRGRSHSKGLFAGTKGKKVVWKRGIRVVQV